MLKQDVKFPKSTLCASSIKPMKRFYGAAAVVVLMTTAAAPAFAETQLLSDEGYSGGKARVNKSASLRSLSEQLASASCRVNAGIEVDAARGNLSSTRQQFRTVLTALEFGNPALGIPSAETRARTLVALNQVNQTLTTLDGATKNLMAGDGNAADAALIAATRSELFDGTLILASEVSGQYSDPFELTQSDAITLDFADRQRTMAHRIARIICELESGTGTAETLAELKRTTQLVETTLIALRDGYPAAAITPPPTEAVKASIAHAYDTWTKKRPFIDRILNGETPTNADVIRATDFATAFNVEINNAITMFMIGSTGQESVYRYPLEQFARSELATWLNDEDLLNALKAQNIAHADLTEDQIIALDQDWRAQAGEGGGPLISKLLEHPVSGWLWDKQIATSGFVTEVFVMDNRGLNVAQSVETSDYWQGDEAKWQETYKVSADALHISEVEFDDSTGYYQAQASLPITDPETEQVIGAITFGVNVQSLM